MTTVWKPALAMAGFVSFAMAAPSFAQTADEAPQVDNEQIAYVYGDDAAPDCPEGNICVVARLPENDRYRIPPTLRTSDSIQNSSWAKRVERLEFVGDFGTLSCSPAGAGGVLGCTQKMIDAAFADKREGAGVRFSQLIQAAREERLSTIDEDAALQQERVEQLEREYLEGLERERQAPLPGEQAVDSEAAAPASGDNADALSLPPQ